LGVTIIDPLQHKSGGKHTWCFVDCTSAPTTLDISICARNVQLYPIYITSPDTSRWSQLHKRRIPNVIVMNPWTIDEMLKARVLYPNRNHNEVIERFHNAGPSARLCLKYTSNDLERFYKDRTIIQTIGAGLTMDDIFDKLFIIYRKDFYGMETYTVHPRVCCELRSWLQESGWLMDVSNY